MPNDPMTDDELAALERGEDDTPEEAATTEPEELEAADEADADEPEEAEEAPPPQPQAVPYDRFQQVTQENEQLRNLLTGLSQQVQQPQAQPQQPQRPAYVNPAAPQDRQQWQGFIGETVDGVVDAKVGQVMSLAQQHAMAMNEQVQDMRMRTEINPATGRLKYPDYERLLPEITAFRRSLVQQFGPNAANAPVRYAYLIVKSEKEATMPAQGRARAVKRATAAAQGESAPPARAMKPGQKATKRVEDMSIKEMEKELANAKF